MVLGVVTYRNSFTGVFVLDDDPAIVHNEHIRSLWPLSSSMTAPPEATVAARPIVSLTLAINHALAPADVRDVLSLPANAPAEESARFLQNLWGYHAVNLAIHLLAGLTLFGIVRRTLDRLSPTPDPARSLTIAMFSAAIWVVHPLQTDSVTYIVQRAESLMGLFYLLTLYCAIRAIDSTRSQRWIAASITACALGMGSKEAMVTAPFMVWIWDRVCNDLGGRFLKRTSVETTSEVFRPRLYTGLAATWSILVWLMLTQPRTHSVGFGFAEWPWWRYLITQAGVVAHYLRLAFLPTPLVLDYAWPASSLADVWPQALLLTALLALTIVGIWQRRPLALAGAWFFVILAPTSSIVPIVTEVAAEHRMYLPLAAVIVLIVIAVDALLRRAKLGIASTAGALVMNLAIVPYVNVTNARNLVYGSDEEIWRVTVDARPDNARARNNYAVDLIARGASAEAVPHLQAAVQIDPTFAEAQANLGVALCRVNRCAEGILYIERSVALDPEAASGHRDLAEAYASQGRLDRALNEYMLALAKLPDDVFLLNRAGWILATSTDPALRNGARAESLARHAVELTRRQDVVSLDTLAAASAELDRFDDAIRVAREAVKLAQAQHNDAMVPELTERVAFYEQRKKIRQ